MPAKKIKSNISKETVSIEELIHIIRGQKVILDADLARLYGVPTKVLNQAVKRNRDRFPLISCFNSRKKSLIMACGHKL